MHNVAVIRKILLIAVFALFLFGCGKQIKNSDALLKKSVDLALNNGKWEKALSYAKRAVKLDINNVDAQIMVAICMDKAGYSNEAAKQLRNVILSTPNNFLAELSLGKILYSSQKYEEAYEHLANAYNLNNGSVEALSLYAECAGNILAKTTQELYTKLAGMEQFSDKFKIYNNLGVFFANTQNYRMAFSSFMKAYRLAPKNPIIIANLGIFKDSYQSDSKQAKAFYRKFIAITGGNTAFDEQRKFFSSRLKDLK